jgi:hypothetical protein
VKQIRHPLYKLWEQMRQRCENPRNKDYRWYGARGIAVCERWQTFVNFVSDVGARPDGTSIDRFPNRNGDYGPGNTRWATASQQTRNRSITMLTYETAVEIAVARMRGDSCRAIAEKFGCSKSTPNAILSGRIWKDALAEATRQMERKP